MEGSCQRFCSFDAGSYQPAEALWNPPDSRLNTPPQGWLAMGEQGKDGRLHERH